MAARNPHDVLGVAKSASAGEIKKAYRKLAREYHPDRNPGDPAAAQRFAEVKAAYDVLSDPERRKTEEVPSRPRTSSRPRARRRRPTVTTERSRSRDDEMTKVDVNLDLGGLVGGLADGLVKGIGRLVQQPRPKEPSDGDTA